MSPEIEYPTAREVAVTIVAAARIHDEDPVLTVEGASAARGRWLAMAVLFEAFPETSYRTISAWCGILDRTRNANSRSELAFKRKHAGSPKGFKWWRDVDFEIVKSALAAAIAETDAEIRNRLIAAVANADPAPRADPAEASAGPPRLRLFDITADELRGLPSELIEQLSPETQALAADGVFSPLFGGIKSDVLDVEIPDFSHLQNTSDRQVVPAISPPHQAPAPVSAGALAIAEFQRSRITKTGRGHVIDHRQAWGMVDLGEPQPGRSALDQRNGRKQT